MATPAMEESPATSSEASMPVRGPNIVAIETQQPVTQAFSFHDLLMINQTASAQVAYILSLQTRGGAISETSNESDLVLTRDLSLAAYSLVMLGYADKASPTIDFLLSLRQGDSYYTTPSGTPSSPYAWYEEYTPFGEVVGQSLRGEDQGMALLAVASYITATKNYTLAAEFWPKLESAANFIVYLQQSPEPGLPFTGLYRHGDNWHDARSPENVNGNGSVVYWPYWPEYYHWEEENIRMIMGLRSAVNLASAMGFETDVQKWNASVGLAERGLANESVYNKYETYDYFGSVLWGLLQSEPSVADSLIRSVPASLVTPLGVKDRASDPYLGASDTIDYMTCLVRTGDFTGAHRLLQAIIDHYTNPAGGFYDTVHLDGTPLDRSSMVYSSARFLYFDYVVTTLGK